MWVGSRMVLAGACVLSSVALTGCGDDKHTARGDDAVKVSKANYDKITTGMELHEVEKILGVGNQRQDNILTMPDGRKIRGGADGMVLTWGDETCGISMILVDNKVTVKSSRGL